MSALRGSLLFLNKRGQLLLIESSNESLLQEPDTFLYEPFSYRPTDDTAAAVIDGSLKVIETKALEKNAFLTQQSTSKISGSYVTMRVPGQPHKLATFEFNSFANNLRDLEDDEGSWLGTLAKP